MVQMCPRNNSNMRSVKFMVFMASCLLLLAGSAMPASAMASGVVVENPQIAGNKANILYIEMGGNRAIQASIANGQVHMDATVDALVKSTEQGGNHVVAAINGGFFNAYYDSKKTSSYPDNCPRIYSVLMQDGRLLNGGGTANVVGFGYDGQIKIDQVSFNSSVILRGNTSIGVWGVNVIYDDPKAVMLLTPEFAYDFNVPSTSKVVTFRDGRVAAISPGGNYKMPPGAHILILHSAAVAYAEQFGLLPRVGDNIQVDVEAGPKRAADTEVWNNMRTIIGGGRMLLQNGYVVTEDQNYNSGLDSDAKQSSTSVAQRSFVAVMGDGRLILGECVGSFTKIAEYLQSKGAVDAISLDGGASSALYASGKGHLQPAGRKLASMLVVVDGKEIQKNSQSQSEPSNWARQRVAEGMALNLVPEALRTGYQSSITRREFCNLIVALIEKKTGLSIDTFRNERGVTWAQVEQIAFNDTTEHNVVSCAALGIISGRGNNQFDPHGLLTRQEAAIILERLGRMLGNETVGTPPVFADFAEVSAWAQSGVQYVTAIGIMNGSGQKFYPKGNYTREEGIITMVNAYEKLQ